MPPHARELAEKERKPIEPDFGEAKQGHGLGRASYREKAKLDIRALMTFLLLNVNRMVRRLAVR